MDAHSGALLDKFAACCQHRSAFHAHLNTFDHALVLNWGLTDNQKMDLSTRHLNLHQGAMNGVASAATALAQAARAGGGSSSLLRAADDAMQALAHSLDTCPHCK